MLLSAVAAQGGTCAEPGFTRNPVPALAAAEASACASPAIQYCQRPLDLPLPPPLPLPPLGPPRCGGGLVAFCAG